MSETLQRVLKELPAYLSHFVHILTQPSQLVHAHVHGPDTRERVSQSLAFLILSGTVALVLAVIFPEMTHPLQWSMDERGLTAHALATIRLLFELLGLSALAYLAARVVGVQSGFLRFFGLMAAVCGVMLVIQVLASALTNISLADPVTAKGWIQLEKGMAEIRPLLEQEVLCATDPVSGEVRQNRALATQLQTQLSAMQKVYLQATQRPLFQLAAGLQWLAAFALLLWSGWIWLCYLKAHAVSAGKRLLATLLLAVLSSAGMLLYDLVNAGTGMMALYRQCG